MQKPDAPDAGGSEAKKRCGKIRENACLAPEVDGMAPLDAPGAVPARDQSLVIRSEALHAITDGKVVEPGRIELPTSSLRTTRSPN